jgi:hypothetical protein
MLSMCHSSTIPYYYSNHKTRISWKQMLGLFTFSHISFRLSKAYYPKETVQVPCKGNLSQQSHDHTTSLGSNQLKDSQILFFFIFGILKSFCCCCYYLALSSRVTFVTCVQNCGFWSLSRSKAF